MKILYGAIIVLASASGLYAMDDSLTKQTAATSFSSKFTASSSSTPSLSYASSPMSPRAFSSSNIMTSTRTRSNERPPSPVPTLYERAVITGYSDRPVDKSSLVQRSTFKSANSDEVTSFSKKLSSSSLPTIPETKESSFCELKK